MTDLRQRLSRLSPEKRALLEQKLLQSAGGEMTPVPIARIPRDGELPLSFAQVRLWLLDRLEPDSATYNIPSCFRLKGEFNLAAFEQSLTEIVRRHEVLRTCFLMVYGQLVQKVVLPEAFQVPVVDLRGLSSAAREEEAARLALADGRQLFDFSRAPLMRATLLQLAADEYLLLLNVHHIAFDGWSFGVFAQELSVLYKAFLHGLTSPLPELPIQYADFAVWQRQWLQGEVLQTQLDYWREKLRGSLPVLELPADRPRPAVQTYDGSTVSLVLSRELTEGLKALSRREGCTLFVTLLAAFQVLLLRYTGQEDILVGTPIANRNRAETEALIGLFVNTLVMRGDLSGNPRFGELLGQVRETALGAYAHRDLPFERLVEELHPERDLSRSPIFQVLLSLQNTPTQPLELPGLEASRMRADSGTSKFDLTVSAIEAPGGLSCTFEYNTHLFNGDRVERMAGHLRVLLRGIVADPEQRLSELPLLAGAERQQLLMDWNDTRVDCPADACLHELFETQAKKTPEAVAVEFEGSQLCYRELNERANRLAHYLRGMGVGPDTLVGVSMERSLELVVALYGVLKAGGAYVPIDPEYPRERMAFMLQDADVPVLLTQARLAGLLPGHNGRVVCVDEEWEQIARQDVANPAAETDPTHLAYMIYTSGSTGRPKGAMNTHRGICNRLLWMQDRYGLTEADRVLQKTPFSFDVSVWEFFWPLLAGARLVVAEPGGHRDAAYLVKLIREQRITVLHFVPSMLRAFLEEPEVKRCQSLGHVICSGEALPYDLQEQFFRLLPSQLYNLYGPTEAGVDVTHWTCRRDDERKIVPIGRPVANTQIYILDRRLQPVPMGVPGELHIGGVQVGRGYHKRPELTAEKFIPDPFSGEPEARLYKTGDLCRWLRDGAVEYLGRMDFQVKIRGFRIELGEIEDALRQHPAVNEAVVTAREDTPGDKRLVAYVVLAGEPACAITELRDYLKQKLPDYMAPAAFVLLPELPLSPNGKVDRKALPAPEEDACAARGYEAPQGDVETTLAGIWTDLLNVKRVGRHDHFFELGGHSLLATQLASRIRSLLGVNAPLRSVFESPTVAQFAEYIQAVRWNSPELPQSLLALGVVSDEGEV